MRQGQEERELVPLLAARRRAAEAREPFRGTLQVSGITLVKNVT